MNNKLKKIIKTTVAALIVTSLLTGCAGYSTRALPGIDTVMATNSQRKDNVHIGAKFLSSSECKSIFGSSDITKKYQPVVIAIKNNSGKSVVFRKDQLNFTTYPAEQVAADYKFSTVGRATGYGVAALFIWPLAIPAIIDGMGSSAANDQMQSDFALKEISNSEIHSGMNLVGVVFLEKMKSGNFLAIKLFDTDQQLIDTYTFSR